MTNTNRSKFLHYLEKLISIFAFLFTLLCLLLVFRSFTNDNLMASLINVLFIFIVPYLFPLVLFRVLQSFAPSTEGKKIIGRSGWSPWLVGFRIQSFYQAFPFLENILRTFPPIYSFWLRCWGSKIGKNVLWTPNIEVIDRDSLIIGDNVLFGHQVMLISHVIMPSQDGFQLYQKKIEIEDNCFIGAGTRIGPGCRVPKGSLMPVESRLKVNETFQSPKSS